MLRHRKDASLLFPFSRPEISLLAHADVRAKLTIVKNNKRCVCVGAGSGGVGNTHSQRGRERTTLSYSSIMVQVLRLVSFFFGVLRIGLLFFASFGIVLFASLRIVSLRFVPFYSVPFRFVPFRFVGQRLVSVYSVSVRFIALSRCLALRCFGMVRLLAFRFFFSVALRCVVVGCGAFRFVSLRSES